MIYYLIMHFIEPAHLSYPNPFDIYDYGLGVNIAIEIGLVILTYWVCKIIGYRLSINNKLKFVIFPILYVVYYAIVWGCFWIPEFTLALAASIFALLVLNAVLLIIIDKCFKERRN